MWSENSRLVFRAYTLIKFFLWDISPLFSFGSFYFLFFNHLTCFFSLFSSKALFFFSLLFSILFLSVYINAGHWYVGLPHRLCSLDCKEIGDAALPHTHVIFNLLVSLLRLMHLHTSLTTVEPEEKLILFFTYRSL